MKEKLASLKRIPKPVISQATRTMLNTCQAWENTTKE
jgi:hypothetical protein